jgi:hypothetical protein
MSNQPTPADSAPMSDAEIKLRAAHEGETAQVILTARRNLLERVQALREQQAAERAAFRAAEKAGVPFERRVDVAERAEAKAKGRRAK